MKELLLGGPGGLSLRLLSTGASWVGCALPLPEGGTREVLLGFDTPEAHHANRSYVGATVGRWANRIVGPLSRGGLTWPLVCEPGQQHQLHGGPGGFHQREWTVLEHSADHAVFGLHSADGDQGFPGALEARVRYTLGPGLSLTIAFEATLNGEHACPVALTNHAYFKLDGRAVDVREQTLQLAAGLVLPVDERGWPTGGPHPVAGTRFDFRQPRRIEQAIDHAFLLHGGASLHSADGRVGLHLDTSLPALQVYTGEHLAQGTQGRWPAFGGVALEPGYLPDSPHHPEWPQPEVWLAPGGRWVHHIRYRFTVS
ncbi:MAG: galactose-1-epimerase [Rubrivivax sp.]